MNRSRERLEGSVERSGLQAILRLEGLRPSEDAGGVVHVPDPDLGALQRKPHALFRRTQRLDGLIPLGDVGAGTERADDLPAVVSQHRVPPLDQPFLARPRQHGVLADRLIAGRELAEPHSERVSQPNRKACLDPIAPQQLVSGPSENGTCVAIRQRDPPFQVQREEDDFRRVQVSLRPVPLTAHGRLRLFALEDLLLEVLGPLLRNPDFPQPLDLDLVVEALELSLALLAARDVPRDR